VIKIEVVRRKLDAKKNKSYHSQSKSNYFTNIREKYSSRTKHEPVDQRPQNLKKLVSPAKTFNQTKTESLANKITSTAAKFGMNVRSKRNGKLERPVSCRVAFTLKNKTYRKDRNFDSVDKGFNNTTHSTLKSNRSIKTYLSKKKTSSSKFSSTVKDTSLKLKIKRNQHQLSSTNADTKLSSQVDRSNFRRFRQIFKSNKPVKKVDVTLDIVHVIYKLDEFKDKEVEKEVSLDVSDSSNTEFNVFS
jgi:hypothetical protein